jgi:hypothetical protein
LENAKGCSICELLSQARIVPPEEECENGIESEIDTIVVQNRQQLCRTLGVMFRQHMVTLLVL